MTTGPTTARGDHNRSHWWTLGALVVAVVALHLSLVERWGYHRDELYFIDCGRHLAWGYVDHAPVVPWLAHLACEIGDCSLLALRLPSIIARGIAVALTGFLVWQLGGRTFATFLAGTTMVIAPAFQRMGKILCIPVFEPIWWTAAAIVLVRLIHGGARQLWLVLGVIAGIGLLTKHTMLIWGLALLVGVVLTPLRKDLRTPWPWLGGVLALLIFAPQLNWQAHNDWATVEFLREISEGMLAAIPRHLFVLGQFLYMHPFAIPLWVAGLVFCFSRRGKPYRILGWIFVVSFLVFFWRQGKPYYLAPAYPAMFAAGAVLLERKVQGAFGRGALAGALVAGGLVLTPMILPILPLEKQDEVLEATLGAIVPPIALTHDIHDEYGWPEQVATVATVFDELPAADRANALILASNYGQASAVNFFGPAHGLPRAVTGHMTHFLWGPNETEPSVVIAYGYERARLEALFAEVERSTVIDHPLANSGERELPVYVCRRPYRPLHEVWPEFKRYAHGGPKELR